MQVNFQNKTPALWQSLQLISQPTRFLENCIERYGDPFTVRVLGLNSPPVVFFSHPQAIKEIFTLPGEKFDFKKATHVFKPLMGDKSIILQEGRSHQRQKQLMIPPFHGDRMKNYGEIICQITTEVIQQWTPGKVISLQHEMSDITLQIILQVVFGISPGARYNKIQELLSSLLDDVTKPWYSSLFFFPPLQKDLGAWSPWGQFLRRRQEIDELIYSEISQRRQEQFRTDILSLLMSAQDEDGQQMTDVELRDQLVSLLLLGYETTAAALSWAFYLIHSSPQVLANLLSELAQTSANPEKITALPYLTAVCQETLRIYPIGLVCTPRMIRETVQINGESFGTGTIIVPCIYLAHRRLETYSQPNKFLPERFIDNRFSPYEYLPFGGGIRGCIGVAFSLYEMKLVLATILSKLELALADSRPAHPVRRGITIVPSASGMKMIVTAQKQPAKVPVL
ncbi:cytochrome P450 [Gloeocapsopsis dulcis]|uniref:Cytochrome P450 n=1 Tax=Gloeocapsopsis dulcis AAB1 = 1H9 TaxID=1433147 RepID=A0A6N8FRL0_9CHRO|nr:cytochrome P450 [Gloeocapsopsis dulcis]MUL35404.1 cytochrome P450 [Gloeocapsopsis dulcis AAB1 = 1H9]WNN90398.1 cytochrome P450 [Gloeocapsopsis dulcis]